MENISLKKVRMGQRICMQQSNEWLQSTNLDIADDETQKVYLYPVQKLKAANTINVVFNLLSAGQ